MFENLPPLHRPNHDADTPRRRALNALGTVLATLPPPWRVLRDASPSGEGAGLGVRFVALHPNFGIALVDLAPARPKAAIAPLRNLLARGNGAIFTTREPPIASVLLARDELPLAAARVEATLAELPPSGIANPAWPEIAIALVTASYPHMMPTDGGRRAIPASAYPSQPNAVQRAPEAPVDAPPPRQETARSAAASAPAAPAAPPARSRESAEQAPAHAAEAPGPTPEAPEQAAARFGAGMPSIDIPRIDVPQFEPRHPDHGALEVPTAAIETPLATGAPEVSQASVETAPPSEGEQPAETPSKPETVETPQPDGRQAARRKRVASPRTRSRRSDPKPSVELPEIEIPRPGLNDRGEAWMSQDRPAQSGPRFDVPRIDVPQPPPQPSQERAEASDRPGETRPRRFDRSPERNPASDEPGFGLGGSGAPEPKQPHLRLVAERDPIAPWPDDKRGARGRKRGRPMLWVVGGTLSVIIAAVLAFPHFAGEPVDSTRLTQASTASTGPAPAPQQAATASPAAPDAAPQQAENAPATAAPMPIPSPSAPTETAEVKPVAPPQSEQSNPAAAPRAATILPPVGTLPETLSEKSIAEARHGAPAEPASQATREAAATPAPKPAVEAKAKSTYAPKLAKARRNAPEVTREAEAEIAPKPVPAPRRGVPPKASAQAIASAAIHPRDSNTQQAAPSDKSDASDAAMVTVDGTSYVAGREPHFLGSLPSPAELASAPASVSASPQADTSPAPSDSPPAGPLPPSTDFAITPQGVMTPSGVVTPFGR